MSTTDVPDVQLSRDERRRIAEEALLAEAGWWFTDPNDVLLIVDLAGRLVDRLVRADGTVEDNAVTATVFTAVEQYGDLTDDTRRELEAGRLPKVEPIGGASVPFDDDAFETAALNAGLRER